MNDKDIIKALEWCGKADCVNCPYIHLNCRFEIARKSLDLINRLQAENERLQKVQIQYSKSFLDEFVERLKNDFSLMLPCTDDINKVIDELAETMKIEFNAFADFTDLIKAEAIKEFAERLKGLVVYVDGLAVVVESDIDNLVKEMVGEE